MKHHREIASALNLFHSEPAAPGMVFWHPDGWQLFRKVKQHMRNIYHESGFQELSTPIFLKKELWELSGHWDKFAENMFVGGGSDVDAKYALKPMSCPAHILFFKRDVVSYRALPYRVFEFGVVHRNEPSGALNGLMRLRQFTQDDAHVLCRWEDCVDEILQFLSRAKRVYRDYGYSDLDVRISTRPENSFGKDNDWLKAEERLAQACEKANVKYSHQKGEGAFYGPKIELILRDSQNRQWQCGTIQLDFNMPLRFQLNYIDEFGDSQQPVMLHQAIYGSLERWIGILLESHQGKLPAWVHPIPVGIAPINASSNEHCLAMKEQLLKKGIQVNLNDQPQSIAKKIKLFHRQRIPIVLIAGDQEVESNSFVVRPIDGEQQTLSFDEVIKMLMGLTNK